MKVKKHYEQVSMRVMELHLTNRLLVGSGEISEKSANVLGGVNVQYEEEEW